METSERSDTEPDKETHVERGEDVRVTALRSSPDRTVFTEDGNSDGWISIDVTVDLER